MHKSQDKFVKRLIRLSDELKNIGLDLNWILTVSALSAQEIALKKKLDDLGEDYGEKEDFQVLSNRLEQTYKELALKPPLILLSISRSYRHIRAKLIHEGHKYPISDEEAKGVLGNTKALIDELFVRERLEAETVESLRNLADDEIMNAVRSFEPIQAERLMKSAIDALSKIENSKGLQNSKGLFFFIKSAIGERDLDRTHLFELFFNSFFPTNINLNFGLVEMLLAILEDSMKIISVRDWIVKNGQIDTLISELARSRSFDMAGVNTGMILGFLSYLTKKQIAQIVDAAISNEQIRYSYRGRRNIKSIADSCKGKIDKTKLEELRKKLR